MKLLATILALLATSSSSPTSSSFTSTPSSTYTNPVIESNTPDPGILALPGGGYAVVATSDHATEPATEPALQLFHSLDMVSWESKGHVFLPGRWPDWAARNMWAPEIHLVNGTFLVYFSASAPNGRHSIGVAVSTTDSPFGPYRDLGYPLVYHNEDSLVGPIDQHHFLDPSTGLRWLTWKTDHMINPRVSEVVIQQLHHDGLSFVEGSSPVKIMSDDHDHLPEEHRIVEGMWFMYREGTYYLFYSASMFQLPSYHVGVARASHILGPYTKSDTPVVQTDWERYNAGVNCTFEGPGHGSVVVDGAGDWWLAYHTWRFGHADRAPGRVMALDRLAWTGFPGLTLWPRVTGGRIDGVPSDTPQPSPAV